MHADALGHVRAVTSSAGEVVFAASYDAWGNQLSVTDDVPDGGFMYRFMGRWGVRWDAESNRAFLGYADAANFNAAYMKLILSMIASPRASVEETVPYANQHFPPPNAAGGNPQWDFIGNKYINWSKL